jgi:hypothetical protein
MSCWSRCHVRGDPERVLSSGPERVLSSGPERVLSSGPERVLSSGPERPESPRPVESGGSLRSSLPPVAVVLTSPAFLDGPRPFRVRQGACPSPASDTLAGARGPRRPGGSLGPTVPVASRPSRRPRTGEGRHASARRPVSLVDSRRARSLGEPRTRKHRRPTEGRPRSAARSAGAERPRASVGAAGSLRSTPSKPTEVRCSRHDT